jgi:hypothetical protein
MALHSDEPANLYRSSGVVNILKLMSLDGLGKENNFTQIFDTETSEKLSKLSYMSHAVRQVNIYLYFNNSIKIKGKFALEQTMKAQRGRRSIALLFLVPRL